MKILWYSDPSSAPSAFGQQTSLFLPRLRAAGHDVTLFAGNAGSPTHLPNGTLVLPHAADRFGNDVVLGHFEATGTDAVLTLIDPHILNPEIYAQIPWIAWAPIDCSPVAPNTMRSLQAARWIWTPSRFDEEQLHRAGFSNVTYVPHGIPSTTFRPLDRTIARRALSAAVRIDLTDKFVVAMVAANTSRPSRKGFYEAFAAFKNFSEEVPNSILYVHSEASGCFGGEDLRQITALVGLDDSKIAFSPQYQYVCGMLNANYLAAVYNAADVYLSASHGEGAGLCSLEAQMCGTPVAVPKNSSQTEFCLTGELAESIPYMAGAGYTWSRPDVKDLARALRAARFLRESGAARERVLGYDVDTVFENYMKPALAKIAVDLLTNEKL